MFFINLLTTILVCIMIISAFVKNNQNDLKSNVSTEQGKYTFAEKYDKYIIAVEIVLLISVRLVGFGIIPGGYNCDTVLAAVEAKSLADCGIDLTGKRYPILFEAYGYGQMSVLMSYIMIPFIKWGGTNLVTVTFPILIFSLMGALSLYGFSKDVFGNKVASIVLLLVAINPWHFMQGRWALDCNMLPHLFISGIFLINRFCKKNKVAYLYVSMLLFALCMYAYSLAFISVPIFLLGTCIILKKEKIVSWKQILISVSIYIGLAWPIYACMIINALKLDTIVTPFFTIPLMPNNTRSSDMVFFAEQPIQQLLANIKTLIYVVFYRHDNLLWNAIPGFGTIYVCTLPFVFLGIVLVINKIVKVKEMNRKIGYILLMLFYFSSLCTGVIVSRVNINRINIIFYEHIVFAGVGIFYVIKSIRKFKYTLAGIYGILFVLFLNFYFTDWNVAFNKRFDKDMMDGIEYASKICADEYHIDADETFVIFGFDLDMSYYWGKTDDFNGKEIAYTERFIYDKVEKAISEDERKDKSIVYIQRISKKDRFLDYSYDIVEFGDWFVAVADD